MNATEAKKALESYKLARITVMKTGHVTEQDPLPVTDPLTGNVYELRLNKEYLMPQYMEHPLMDCYRPQYATVKDGDGNAVTDHKEMSKLHLNIRVASLTESKDKYLEDHPEAAHAFSVDEKLITKLKNVASPKSGSSKAKAEPATADFT
jgi:hypothetical protein